MASCVYKTHLKGMVYGLFVGFLGLLNISSCQYWIMTMVDTCLNTTGPIVVGLYKEQKECLFSLNQVDVFFLPET